MISLITFATISSYFILRRKGAMIMFAGYLRPLHDLDIDEQYTYLKDCDIYFQEAHTSPKRRNKLKDLLNHLQKGDKVIVARLNVLADSTNHLAELLNELDERKIYFKAIHEEIDTSDETGKHFLPMLNKLISFQSDVISENTRRGLTKAKEQGKSSGRPKKPDENVKKAIEMYQTKNFTLLEIKEQTGISKSTLYRYLEQLS
ncbi:recombinase family protein [Cytobacillus kochii]|uniref:recombinase family protein n=1 Tax=Cytobacillus kochii TaxID=859143 RepID=UPI001CD4EE9A|nr:recombinase family protein [Cytobacillus kochii]MCA1024781.1 recombinase family protein [Cytobacillus kochii]